MPLVLKVSRTKRKLAATLKAVPLGKVAATNGSRQKGGPPERADFPSFRPKSHVLGRKTQTFKQSAQKDGAKFGGDGFDRSREKKF